MSNTRPVPTNLDTQVGVNDLNVVYKHLLHVLWSSPSSLVSVIGVGRAGIIEHLTGASRSDEPVVLEALRELHRRGLVVLDEQTREVAIRRWCKFHKFPGRWAAQAKIAYERIESPVIKGVLVRYEGVNAIFPEKSKAPDPNSNNNSNCNKEAAAPRAHARGTADAAASGKKRNVRPSGIITWLPSDVLDAEAIEQRYTSDDITAAAAAITAAGKQPVPGLIQQKIEQQKRDRGAAERRAAIDAQLRERDQINLDPAAMADGMQKLSPEFRAQLAQKSTAHQEATP